jgi:hypothetical protein
MPECYINREEHLRIEVATCVRENGNCHVNTSCPDKIMKRIHILFEEVTLVGTQKIFLYFRKINNGLGSIVFDRHFDKVNPKWITLNVSWWRNFKGYSDLYSCQLKQEFFL